MSPRESCPFARTRAPVVRPRRLISVGRRISRIAVAVIACGTSPPRACVAAEPPLTLHVAPGGDDRWTGLLVEPDAGRSDGPLASLEGARDRLRKLRAEAGGRLGPVTVSVAGGLYCLARPFVLEPEDSGAPDAPVVFAARAGERPVFRGGRALEGFREADGLWRCEVPDAKAGALYFRQLFVDGARRPRARAPNEGWFRVAGLLPGPKDAQGKEIARDLRLRPDSPAFELGFRAIDISSAGLRGDPAWVEEGRRARHPRTVLPPPPPPPEPRTVDDGFEGTEPGAPPAGAIVDGESRGASIRVVEEAAAEGTRCLKVTDSRALEPSWQPHF